MNKDIHQVTPTFSTGLPENSNLIDSTESRHGDKEIPNEERPLMENEEKTVTVLSSELKHRMFPYPHPKNVMTAGAPRRSLKFSTNQAECDSIEEKIPHENVIMRRPRFSPSNRLEKRVSVHEVVTAFKEHSKQENETDEKFVINLYGRRFSRNWQRHSLVKTRKELEQLKGNRNISLPVETLHIQDSKRAAEEKLQRCLPVGAEHKQKDDERFNVLRKQADFQCEIMKQASMAVENCRGRYFKESFIDYTAEVDAERLLLISSKYITSSLSSKALIILFSSKEI